MVYRKEAREEDQNGLQKGGKGRSAEGGRWGGHRTNSSLRLISVLSKVEKRASSSCLALSTCHWLVPFLKISTIPFT
jgi:hypothetical protein